MEMILRLLVLSKAIKTKSIAIAKQPQSNQVAPGGNAIFTVEAYGNNLSYQWYYKRPSEKEWFLTTMEGYNTNTLTVEATETRNGYQYYCEITNANGDKVNTAAATLTVK